MEMDRLKGLGSDSGMNRLRRLGSDSGMDRLRELGSGGGAPGSSHPTVRPLSSTVEPPRPANEAAKPTVKAPQSKGKSAGGTGRFLQPAGPDRFGRTPGPAISKRRTQGSATGEYTAVVKGLQETGDRMDAGVKELEGLKAAYDANPSAERAQAYNSRLEQLQKDQEEYNRLVERYGYFTTAEGLKERIEEMRPLAQAAQREKQAATAARAGARTQAELAAGKLRVEAAEQGLKRVEEYNDLLELYYMAENEEKKAALKKDGAALGHYISAKELGEDLDRVASLMAYATDPSGDAGKAERDKKYLAEKYGLDEAAIREFALYGGSKSYQPRAGGGYNNLSELYRELQNRMDTAVEELGEQDYDYGRMERYARMKQDAESYEKRREVWQKFAREHPYLSSAATALVSPAQGADFMTTMARGKDTSDDTDLEHYEPMNVYRMNATNFVNEVRGTVAEKLAEKYDWEIFGQNVASFAYQTGMSIADSAVQVHTLGKAATLFMGASAASNQAKNVIQRGGTNKQAFWGGLAAGAAECAFEYVSIDKLLSPRSVGNMKDLLRETVKQAGVEASEEMLTEISNILSDAAVMGQRSEFAQAVEQYRQQGMSYQEAKKQAFLDCVGQVFWAGAGGALSGGVMGGAVSAANYGTARSMGKSMRELGPDVEQAIIEEGLDSAGDTDSYRRAVRLQEMQNAGKKIGVGDIGQLYLDNVAAIEAEERGGMLPRGDEVVGTNRKTASTGEAVYKVESLITEENMSRYRAQVDRVFSGELPLGSDIVMGKTPSLLQAYGASDADLHMTQSVARKIAYPKGYFGGKHNLGMSVLKNMPYQLADPIAILKNPQKNQAGLKSLIVLTEWTDPREQPIVIPIHLDAQGAIEVQNNIASAFGADYINRLLGENDENVLYTKNNEDIRQLLSNGRRMPEAMADDILAKNMIPQAENAVKDAEMTTSERSEAEERSGMLPRGDEGRRAEAAAPHSGQAVHEERALPGPTQAVAPGLVRDEYVRSSVDAAVADRVDAAARALGVNVRYVESIQAGTGEANEQINGAFMLLSQDMDAPEMLVVGHGLTHRLQELAPKDYNAFKKSVRGEVKGEVERIMELYRSRGLEMDEAGALDEAVADYAGQMIEDGAVLDEFIRRHREDRGLLEKLRDIVRSIIDKLTGRAREKAQTAEGKLAAAYEAAAEAAKGLPTAAQWDEEQSGKYLIKYDQSNTPFVEVEGDILAGVPKRKWIATVKETLSERFPDGVRVGNSTIKINSQTRREVTFSEYTKWLARNDKSIYADKFRAAGYADEIILASRGYINEGLKHARKDNIKDFARGTVLLRIGGTDYSAEVVVGTTSSGEMLLYDIVNMQETAIKEKDSRYTVQPNQAEGRRSGASATGDSIRQGDGKSNGKFSLKGSRPTYAKQDFRRNMMALFSIPEGQRAELGRALDAAAEKIVREGALTDEARQALFDRLYDSGEMAEAAELAREESVSEGEVLENLERQMDFQLRAFAEKAGLEIRLKDRTERMLAQERTARREQAARQRERKALRELQQKTLKQAQWLAKNQHKLPGDLKEAARGLLEDLDTLALGTANEMHWSEKYGTTWRDLRDAYLAAAETDPNFIPSKEIQKIVTRLDAKKIGELDVGALNDLCRAITGIRTEVTNRNRLLGEETEEIFADLFAEMREEIPAAKGGRKAGEAGYDIKGADKYLNLLHLTPMNALQRMGGWKKDGAMMTMARQLEQGERAERAYQTQAKAALADFLRDNEAWVKRADGQGKDAIWYEIEVPELLKLGRGDKPIFGDTVTVYMTPAQKVHLYLESKNVDNLRHIAYGGRTFAIRELYAKGQRGEAFAQSEQTIRLAPETVKRLVSDLTPEEQALADLLERHYNEFAKGKINAVSNVLYGFDKTIGSHYAPIFTNSNYNKAEIGVFDLTPEGVGNLKERTHGVNPTYNISAFDAFERSVAKTSQFVGKAIAKRNWDMMLNYQDKGGSFKQLISSKWGKAGMDYITDLLTEWEGNSAGERSSPGVMDTALSNYISAVFGFNPSIILKQFMSYPLAATYLGWENMADPVRAQRIDDGLINTYTSEYAYRLLGYATPETAQLKDNPTSLADRLGGTALGQTKAGKGILDFTTGKGITAMDGWTVKAIWAWAEKAVRRENPELAMGTQVQIEGGQSPFYQEVARRFEEAVSNSQPMYDVMHRAGIMRKSGAGWRALTLFKTVPIQQYNMLRQSVEEAAYVKRAYEAGQATREEFSTAKGKAGRAVTGVILAGFGLEAVNLLAAMVKNRGKRYRDDEEELTAASVTKELLAGFAADNMGMIAGGDLLADMLGSILSGGKWYGITAPGFEQTDAVIEKIVDEAKGVRRLLEDGLDIARNGGDVKEYFRRHGADFLGAVKDAGATVATYFGGVAANNIEAYVLGAASWLSPEIRTAYEDAWATADKYGLKGLKDEALEGRVESILHNRLGRAEEDTVKALAELYEAGFTGAVFGDTPESLSAGGQEKKLGAYQQQVFDALWRETVGSAIDELVSSKRFREAEPEKREELLKALYDYGRDRAKAALFDDYEGSAGAQRADRYQAQGGTLVDYLAAYEAQKGIVGDKNGEGSTIPLSASRKKKAAIDAAAPEATREQRELLYELFGVSEKVWRDDGDGLGQLPGSESGIGGGARERDGLDRLRSLGSGGNASGQTGDLSGLDRLRSLGSGEPMGLPRGDR